MNGIAYTVAEPVYIHTVVSGDVKIYSTILGDIMTCAIHSVQYYNDKYIYRQYTLDPT